MSGIFGIMNRNDRAVDPDDLQKMHLAMAQWGPDGHKMWTQDACGMGMELLYNTPEAVYENTPKWLPQHNLLFVCEARIDNREELAAVLRILPCEQQKLADSDFVLRSWLRWGENTPDHLVGDWSFAVWQADKKHLYLARDHHGNTSLYYYVDEKRFVFASSMNALRAVCKHLSINEYRLAQYLTGWIHAEDETLYKQIRILPPAHFLQCTPHKMKKNYYWQIEHIPYLYYKKHQDYIEGFYEVFSKAVRAQIRSYGLIGSTLSGGLDSSSVTAMAARDLQNSSTPLYAFTAIPKYAMANADRLQDESILAAETAVFYKNIKHVLLKSEIRQPIAAIEAWAQFHGDVGFPAPNAFWLVDLAETARNLDVRTLLIGQMGNTTISYLAPFLAQPFSNLSRNIGYKKAFKRKFLYPTIPLRLDMAYQRCVHADALCRLSGAHPQWLKQQKIWQHMFRLGFDPDTFRCYTCPRDWHIRFADFGRCRAGNSWSQLAAAFGLEIRDPTGDRRLLEYSMSIPERYFIGPQGEKKYMLKRMMHDILPQAVLQNKLKSLQSADIIYRLEEKPKAVNNYLDKMKTKRYAGIFDLEKIHQVWQEAQKNKHITDNIRKVKMILLKSIAAAVLIEKNQK